MTVKVRGWPVWIAVHMSSRPVDTFASDFVQVREPDCEGWANFFLGLEDSVRPVAMHPNDIGEATDGREAVYFDFAEVHGAEP